MPRGEQVHLMLVTLSKETWVFKDLYAQRQEVHMYLVYGMALRVSSMSSAILK